jgi:hypothetical protein
MREARDGQPQILVAPPGAEADHQFVHLQGIATDGRQQRVGKSQPALVSLFLSTARTVSRPALKVRAMARWDIRSPNALTMRASFCALKVRLFASGDHVFWHA